MRRPRAPVCCAVLVAALLGACSAPPRAVTPSAPPVSATAVEAAAQSLLEAWTSEHSSDGPDAVFAVGQLVRQDGDWTADADPDAHKLAAVDGLLDLSPDMTVAGVPNGTVQWADGSIASPRTLSPAEALAQALERRTTPDAPVAPLVVVAASATSTSLPTSRGTANVPAWELTLRDSSVRLVVVAAAVSVPTPPATPGREVPGVADDTVSIGGVRVGPDGRTLTVGFTGSPQGADEPCGEDYSASAVANDSAVVVTVVRHPHDQPGGDVTYCSLAGADRHAVTVLDSALAGRPVLDVTSALPVPVS